MEERTRWRGQNESQTEGEEKWQTCWCCRDQQRAGRMAQASAQRGEGEREHGEEKVDFTVKEGRFQGAERGQVRRASLGEAKGSTSG